jgi:hypothetical protein
MDSSTQSSVRKELIIAMDVLKAVSLNISNEFIGKERIKRVIIENIIENRWKSL